MLRLPRLLFTLILVFLVWFQMQAQTVNECAYKRPHEADTWCFYSKIRMGFNSGSPSIQNLPSPLNSGKGCASISDKNGDLLLYTDGMSLWNKNSTLLSNTLSGDLGSTQSSLFVPNPNGLGKYYIFTTHLLYPPPLTTNGLCYSTIHMDSISGVDTLPVKKLLAKTPEKLTGVQHSNGIDFWVVAHGWDNNTFYAYKVSKSGVDSIPVESNVGTIQTGTLNSRNMVGAMKISPDGTKLALAIFGAKLVEWFDFDAGSGKVSNPRQISSPDAYGPYGIEFSPDGTKLYFTTVYATTNASNNLYQVDLTGSGTPVLLNTLSNNMTALQLAVDGKIYVARYNYAFLGVIENPNRPDIACNYIEDGLSLNGNQGKMGLPNFIQSYLNIPAVTYETKCHGDDTYFYLNNRSNIDSLTWNFGDPATGSTNISQQLEPSHIFSTPGNYSINLTEWFNNRSFVSTFPVKINPLPPKSFSFDPDSIYILPGSAILLDAGDFMKTYEWSDGSTNETLEVSEPGFYYITIVDTNCCMQQDTMKVLLLDLFVPNAFSPNFDGTNDKFRIKGPTQGIDNYHFYVYNRWGQLLWETDSFTDGWDATFKGVECPAGTYVWVMQFGVTGNVMKKDKIVKRGMVTIVR